MGIRQTKLLKLSRKFLCWENQTNMENRWPVKESMDWYR